MASPRRLRARVTGATTSALAIVVTAGSLLCAPAGPATAATGDVPVGVAPQRPAGLLAATPAPASEQLQLDVALRPRDPAALAAFVTAVSTPGSPAYHHYLAAGQFGARFGATAATIGQVSSALRARGLTVGAPSPNGLSIPVSGSLASVSAAFKTSFAQYHLASGVVGVVNTTAPRLPSEVAASVQGIVGLDQLVHAVSTHPATAGATRLPAALTPAAASGPAACPTATTEATNFGAYTAGQIAHHYGLDSFYASGDLGQGVTIGVFELEPFSASDVAAYQSCYGTHANVSVLPVDGGAGTGTGSGEAALDIEDLIGLAPSANVIVYEAPNNGAGVYDEYRQIVNDDTAKVVTDSWGLCELESGVSQLAAIERPLFQQMAAQGQTMLAATGDSGSEGCYAPPQSTDTSLAVWDPASQPEVTAVGGTTVASVDAADTSWGNDFGASGGGISTLWTMPTYQRQVGAIPDSTAAPCGGGSLLCREIPDVSASADVQHGYLAFFAGQWHAVGGTSAATPTIAALTALVDASCTAGPVGFLNPALYALAGAHSPALTDVASGSSNDFTASHGGVYSVRPGYDLTTGVGRPNGASLATGLCPATAAGGAGNMAVSPNLVNTSTYTSLTFTYTPSSGGMVDGEIDLTVPGTWSLPSTTPTSVGYVTSSAGTLAVSGNTIVLKGITTPAGLPVKLVYGDQSAGSPGAFTPSTAQITTFAASSRTSTNGTMAAVAVQASVRVLPPGGTGSGDGTLARVYGADRIATAVAASRTAYPNAGSAQAVVLASSDNYPDALAGVPLAVQVHGPLLLAPASGITAAAVSEIERVLPTGRTVFVLGGPVALPTSVDQQLQALGYQSTRIAGVDRYDTAVRIAEALGNPATVFEANGQNFPDALSAGPAAVITHGAVLLTAGTAQAPETQTYLAAHASATRYAIGGQAAAADQAATPLVGADRWTTSVLVAQRFFTAPSAVGVASGQTFPDALSGGPVAGLAGGPLVLVPNSGALPSTTQSYLSGLAESVVSGWLFGGPAAVTTPVADEVGEALVLVPPAS